MGGKSNDSGSREMIQMQKAEAADARAREAERQGRIQSGLTRIKQAFEGAPVMATRGNQFDWGSQVGNTRNVGQPGTALPVGFSWANVGSPGGGGGGGGGISTGGGSPGPYNTVTNSGAGRGNAGTNQTSYYIPNRRGNTEETFPDTRYASNNFGGNVQQPYRGGMINSFGDFNQVLQQADPNFGSDWAIRGPDGRIYRRGESIPYFEQYDTGQRTGGIGEDFYNKFRQGILNTQLPQLAEQYGKASDETKFRHARAGTTESTAKVRNIGDLVKQNTIADASIRQKADTAAGDLRNRVNKERAAAEAQLYSTENPDVASTYATNAIRNISAEQPDTSPLAEAFTLAGIGGANLFSGLQNAKRTNETRKALGGYGATRTVA